MNKKFYLIPETEIVELETFGMLATSLGDDITIGDSNQDPVGDDFDTNKY